MQPLKRTLVGLVVALVAFGTSVTLTAQETGAMRLNAVSAQQPVTFQNPYAYIGQDGNVYMADEASGAGQPITGDAGGGATSAFPFFNKALDYGQIVWSPSGNMLAFIDRRNKSLFVVESTKGPNIVARNVDSNFPPAFSVDGKEIAYVVQTDQQSGTNNQDRVLQIQAVPSAGGAPRALGSLVGTPWNCSDAAADPEDMIYFDEINVPGDSPMFFAWTAQGFLHTMGCNGLGLALSDGSKDVWQHPNLQNSAVSPVQGQIISVAYDPANKTKQLNLVDLGTGKLTPVTTQPNLDRAAISADGKTIIYTTIEPPRTVRGNPESAVGKELFGTLWPITGNERGVFVWLVPVAGGQSTLIHRVGGRGIGTISPARHKPSVTVSVITSLAPMIDSINAGDPAAKVLELSPHGELIAISLEGAGPPATIGRGYEPSFGMTGAFTIVPSQVSAPPIAQVPTLVTPSTPEPPTPEPPTPEPPTPEPPTAEPPTAEPPTPVSPTPVPSTNQLPDLVISNVNVSDSTPIRGQVVTVVVTVRNQGAGPADGFVVRWKPTPTPPDYTQQLPGLDAGQSHQLTFQHTYTALGAVEWEAVVDTFNAIAETDEGNNSFRGNLTVQAPPPPPADLVITAITISDTTPTKVQVVRALVTVRNQGASPAGNFIVRWKPTASHSGYSQVVPGLTPGQNRTLTFQHTYTATGPAAWEAVVDATNSVRETNEGNNRRTGGLTVMRRAAVSVTFDRVFVHNDLDAGILPTTSGEMYLTIAVNGQVKRWPANGYRSVRTGVTYTINEVIKVELAENQNLTLSISGRERDGNNFQDMGSVRVSHLGSRVWDREKVHNERSNGCRCYTVSYRISVSYLD